jgi:uncharacterized membrane protein
MDTNIVPAAQVVGMKPTPDRLDSIDLLRGVVMVLMALDHVRDFFSDRLWMDATDLQTTTPGIFLTRWITHYCAPTFIFLAGTGAFLSGARGKSTAALSWFLLTRGLWLVFLALTVIRASWWFNYDLYRHGPDVIWAIGWSMVALSALVYLPTWLITLFGVTMISLHNRLDGLTAEQVGLPEWVWMVLHRPGEAPVVGGITLGLGYCLIPWIGVMAAGYGFGALMRLDRATRRRWCFVIGTMLSLGFILLRAANRYGDPRPWVAQSTPLWTLFSFLNCTKYPPSLLYLLMTLGPAILALAFFDRRLGPLAQPIVTFGRVPLFYYLLHLPLIHGAAVLCDYLRFGWSPLANAGPWEVRPEAIPSDYGLSLPMVYLVWIGVLVLLYPPCRWFAEVKRRSRSAWLSYF